MKKSLAVALCVTGCAAFAADLTSNLEFVDNPTRREWSNNIENLGIADLQFYHGLLFPGVGEVETNPGPVPIYSIDPYTKASVHEFDAGTEQISHYQVTSWGELVAESQDPHEFGVNIGDVFVRNSDGNWRFYDTFKGSMPRGTSSSVLYNTHVWQIVEFGGSCFFSGYGLSRSDDRFVTMKDVSSANGKGYTSVSWSGDSLRRENVFLAFPNDLFVIPRGKSSNTSFEVAHYNPTAEGFERNSQNGPSTLWPNLKDADLELGKGTTKSDIRLYKTTPFNGRVLYILSFDSVPTYSGLRGTAYPIPLAGYTSTKTTTQKGVPQVSATRISFGDDNKNYPWDFTVDNGVLYALTSKYNSSADADKRAHHIVWKSTDGVNFTEVLSFDFHENMVSIEYHDGYFYFGVGCTNFAPGYEYSGACEAGSVYRVRCPQESVQVVSSVPSLTLARGAFADIQISLSAAPSEATTVKLSARGALNGLDFDKSTLDFTTSNWSAPQTVRVSLASDAASGTGNFAVLAGVAGATEDPVHGEFGASGVTSAEIPLTITPPGGSTSGHSHAWSRWITNSVPTETHTGLRTRTCVAGGCSTPVASESEVLPMIGAPAPETTATAIPSGLAVYDIDIYMACSFADLTDFADWPLRLDLQMGAPILGHRKSIEKINDYWTKVTYRCAADLKYYIDYSKTADYTGISTHQNTAYLLYGALYPNNAGISLACWQTGNVALDFNGVSTVEGFSQVLASAFFGKVMMIETQLSGNKYYIRTNPEQSNVFRDIRFRYVAPISAAPSGESLYELTVKFSQSIEGEVTKVQVQHFSDGVLVFENLKVADDNRTFTSKQTLDIADLIAKNNAHAADTSDKFQSKVMINGTAKATGSLLAAPQISGDTPYDLASAIEDRILFRNNTDGVPRVVEFTIKPTEADPEPEIVYTDIHNADEFKAAMAVGDRGYYRLMDNIDLTGSGYISEAIFKGTLEGNGKTITGLGAQPLCVTNQGKIASLTVDGKGAERTGTGIGVMCDTLDGGTFTNCVVKGYTLKHSVGDQAKGNGLFAGEVKNGSRIIACTTAADCTVTENGVNQAYVGGFVGLATLTEAGNTFELIDSTNMASVIETGNTTWNRSGAAGFVGRLGGGAKGGAAVHFVRCVNFGTVSSTGNASTDCIGGFVGFANGAWDSQVKILVEDSVNHGDIVDGGSADSAGGFVGALNYCVIVDIERSANYASVGSAKTVYAGGLVGYACQPDQANSIKVLNSANYGAITGKTVGGLVANHNTAGWGSGTDLFFNSANYGALTGTTVGQILGTATTTAASPTLTIKIDNCWTLDSTLAAATVGTVTKTNNKDASVADETALAALNAVAGSNADYASWHIGETTHPELPFAVSEEPVEPPEDPSEDSPEDLTASVVNLGIPNEGRYPAKYYARNVWDLKVFEGRLYIGSGNSANEGPETNSGPVDIVSYDPETGTYTNELTVLEEQIDVFRILSDDGLYIPGHDPRGGGGLFLRAKNASGANVWQEFKNLTDIEHCYDVTMFDGKLVASGNQIWISSDASAANLAKFGDYNITGRRYSMFVFPNALYAVGTATVGGANTFGIDRLVKGGSFQEVNNAGTTLIAKANRNYVFPDFGETVDQDGLIAKHPVSFGERVVYIGGFAHNDHQMLPVAAYCATDGDSYFTATKIALPEGAVPWDTMLHNGKVYLLWTTKNDSKFVNHVSESADGSVFTELFSFKADTFARSFEYHGGNFYFGLGAENVDIFNPHSAADNSLLSAASGTILSCPYSLGEEPVDPPVVEHTHVWGAWVTNAAPNCTETGLRTRTCTAEGCTTPAAKEEEVLAALGHIEVIDPAVPATTTSTGLTEGKHCSRCGAVLVARQIIPMLDPEEPGDDSDAIRNGFAYYDITISMKSAFPDFEVNGDWPMVMDLLLGQTIIGLRTGVSADNKSVTFRAAMDVGAMIEYSKSADYTSRGVFQSKMYFAYGASDIYNLGNGGASITSLNAKFDFSTVDSLTKFVAAINEKFSGKTVAGVSSGDAIAFDKVEIVYVKESPVAASGAKDYTVTLSFNHPLSELGYATVTRLELDVPNLTTITLDNPTQNGGRYTATVNFDAAALIAQINGETYRASANAQRRIYATGTDADGNAKSRAGVAGASLGLVPEIAGDTLYDLSYALFYGGFKLPYRNSGAAARVTDFSIELEGSEPDDPPVVEHTHVWGAWVTNAAPNCTETGLRTRTCTADGCTTPAAKEEEVLAALGHIEVIDPAVPATTTSTGLTEGKHCSRCGAVLVAQQIIPMLDPEEPPEEPDVDYTDIHNAAEFKAAMESGANGNYRLVNDIDLTGSGYVAVSAFGGQLNGNGKTITGLGAQPICTNFTGTVTGLTVDGRVSGVNTVREQTGGGIFCDTATGATFVSCIVKGYTLHHSIQDRYVKLGIGLFAGEATGASRFEGCVADASCELRQRDASDGETYNKNIGGIVGRVNLIDMAGTDGVMEFVNCTNVAKIVVSKNWNNGVSGVGGIVGFVTQSANNKGISQARLLVDGCVNLADFDNTYDGSASVTLGGIVGAMDTMNNQVCPRVEIVHCSNYGRLGSELRLVSYVGGILGHYNLACLRMDGCVNYGTVGFWINNNHADIAGGLIGRLGRPVQSADALVVVNCANYGRVAGSSVGGLVGVVDGEGYTSGSGENNMGLSFLNCANYGELSGKTDTAQIVDLVKQRDGSTTYFEPDVTIDNCWTVTSALYTAVPTSPAVSNCQTAEAEDESALAALNAVAEATDGYGVWHIGETTHPELMFAKPEEPEEPVDPPVVEHTHVWGAWVTNAAPNCTATGLRTRTCTAEGCTTPAAKEEEVLAALGHIEVIDPAVPATTTSTGLTEGKHCSRCGAVLIAQQIIPMLDPEEPVDPPYNPPVNPPVEGDEWFKVIFTNEGRTDIGGVWQGPKEGTASQSVTNGASAYVLKNVLNLDFVANTGSPDNADIVVEGKAIVSLSSNFPMVASDTVAGLCFKTGPKAYGYGANGWQELSGATPTVGAWVNYQALVSPTNGVVTYYINGTMLSPSLPLKSGTECITYVRYGGSGAVSDVRGYVALASSDPGTVVLETPTLCADGGFICADGKMTLTLDSPVVGAYYTLFTTESLEEPFVAQPGSKQCTSPEQLIQFVLDTTDAPAKFAMVVTSLQEIAEGTPLK